MENQMIESLLSDIFSKKDGDKDRDKSLRGKTEKNEKNPIYRPNYQRKRGFSDYTALKKDNAQNKEANDDLDVINMMRKYSK